MIEFVESLLEELRPHFLAVGITEKQLAALLEESVDHAGLYDALVVVRRQELPAYVYAMSLVPEHMWIYYAAKGVTNLRECRMRRKAEKDLRKAFAARVGIFARKPKKDKEVADAPQQEGSSSNPA